MTEDEWLNSRDWLPLLKFIERKASDRKLRLFGCVCCRRMWDLFPHDVNRKLVEAVEDHPDGSIDDPVLNTAITDSSKVERICGEDQGDLVAKNLGRTYYKLQAIDSVAVARMALQVVANSGGDRKAECCDQTELFRDIFGNPFRPVSVDTAWLSWNDGEISKLAKSIYDDRGFDRLPILAEVLERAGCDNEQILSHCRGPGPHARGCWVLDLLLGNGSRA